MTPGPKYSRTSFNRRGWAVSFSPEEALSSPSEVLDASIGAGRSITVCDLRKKSCQGPSVSVEDASIGRAEDQSEREFSMLQALRSTRYRTLGVALTDRHFKPQSTHSNLKTHSCQVLLCTKPNQPLTSGERPLLFGVRRDLIRVTIGSASTPALCPNRSCPASALWFAVWSNSSSEISPNTASGAAARCANSISSGGERAGAIAGEIVGSPTCSSICRTVAGSVMNPTRRTYCT